MVSDGFLRRHTWKGPVQSIVMVLDGYTERLHIWKGPIQSSAMVLDGSLGIRELERSSPVRCDGFGWFPTYLERSNLVKCDGFGWFPKNTYLERSSPVSCDGFAWFLRYNIFEKVRFSQVRWFWMGIP